MVRVSPEPEQIAGSPHSQGASTADARREPPEGEAAVLRPERPREHADRALQRGAGWPEGNSAEPPTDDAASTPSRHVTTTSSPAAAAEGSRIDVEFALSLRAEPCSPAAAAVRLQFDLAAQKGKMITCKDLCEAIETAENKMMREKAEAALAGWRDAPAWTAEEKRKREEAEAEEKRLAAEEAARRAEEERLAAEEMKRLRLEEEERRAREAADAQMFATEMAALAKEEADKIDALYGSLLREYGGAGHDAKEEQAQAQEKAAVKIQSLARGNSVRKKYAERQAADKMSGPSTANIRPDLSPASLDADAKEEQAQAHEKAAVKIQSLARGNSVRKKYAERQAADKMSGPSTANIRPDLSPASLDAEEYGIHDTLPDMVQPAKIKATSQVEAGWNGHKSDAPQKAPGPTATPKVGVTAAPAALQKKSIGSSIFRGVCCVSAEAVRGDAFGPDKPLDGEGEAEWKTQSNNDGKEISHTENTPGPPDDDNDDEPYVRKEIAKQNRPSALCCGKYTSCAACGDTKQADDGQYEVF